MVSHMLIFNLLLNIEPELILLLGLSLDINSSNIFILVKDKGLTKYIILDFGVMDLINISRYRYSNMLTLLEEGLYQMHIRVSFAVWHLYIKLSYGISYILAYILV